LFDEEITPEFLDGIYRETEGNPFFVEEVSKALVESGELWYEDGRWHRPSMEELGIPQSVRVAIQSRVRVLPVEAQEMLCLAAILGREFDFDTLAEASELGEDTLIDALESAERAQLIEELSGKRGGAFAFAHALFASTLVETTRTLQRRRRHRRAAAAVEARHPDDFEALAHHYTQAGEAEKAADYLLEAGNRDMLIGRGRLQSDASGRVFLRLERVSDRVNAFCSADGENWFTVGHVEFPVEDPLQVGLHAIGSIDRTVYHSAYPDGTAIRFESFQLWAQHAVSLGLQGELGLDSRTG
jgi:hypothetical protein